MNVDAEDIYRLRIWFTAAAQFGWVGDEDRALAARLEAAEVDES